jgi:hypothetical protein
VAESRNSKASRPSLRPGTAAFLLVHVSCAGVFFIEFQLWHVALCLGLYLLRMFSITAGYHRYFSHRGFKTSRAFQFLYSLSQAQRRHKRELSGGHLTIGTTTSTRTMRMTYIRRRALVFFGHTWAGSYANNTR